MLDRPRFTPHRWNSADGMISFYTDSYGMTDILPGPCAGIGKWLKDNYSEIAFLKNEDPYKAYENNIHL
jgi:hypothetical protein